MTTINDKLVAYFRLSRDKKRKNGRAEQSAWGWSLESQQAAADALAADDTEANRDSFIEAYVEIAYVD